MMAPASNDELEAKVKSVLARRRDSDLRTVIRSVLSCPTVSSDPVVEVDGSKPVMDYLNANIDLMTRIVVRIGLSAGNGDVKSAEFLAKYGAYTPAQETRITVMPTIIDDLGPSEIDITPQGRISEDTGGANVLTIGYGDGEYKDSDSSAPVEQVRG